MLDAYNRAAEIYGANAKKHVFNEVVEEKWIDGSQDFWFAKDVEGPDGKIVPEYTRYIFSSNTTALLFDHGDFAEAIKPWNSGATAHDLPVTVHEVDDTTGRMYFSIKDTVGEFAYDFSSRAVSSLRFPLHAKAEVLSPNKKHSLYVRDYNVFVRCNETGKETQLTFDGKEDLEYASRWTMVSERLTKKDPEIMPPAISWSPNSRFALTYRRDTRRVDKYYLIQSDPIDGRARPIGVKYPYSLPGDEDPVTAHVYVLDLENKVANKVYLGDEPFQLLQLSMFGHDGHQVKWTEDGNVAYMLRNDRYYKNPEAVLIDAFQASAKVVAGHTYETFSFTEYYGNASQESFMDSGLLYLPESHELIWLLEKDDWGSLYLFDCESRQIKRDLTPGQYTVRRVRHYDAATRTLYFSASGREAHVDPYYQFLYKVNLDSGELARLNQEPAEHYTRFHKDGAYFIDTFSTIETVPETVICSPEDGKVFCHLTKADIGRILEKGYVVPEPFEALARDGITPIYGMVVKPYGFDPSKKYPVVDYIYGGSQRINTPKAFEFNKRLEADPQGGLQSLAQLGFVGIIVDGLATPLRSKQIHDVVYRKPEECCGIEDHICAIKQLAERYPWIDAERVGIWGASGGGYATVRALVAFPEFFKVGVSLCGNHDQAKYNTSWGDRWLGPYSEEGYHDQANQNFAERLQGHLLLIHGDMDDNVHPSATIKLVAALIKANKDFELLIYPNSGHAVGQFPYVVRKRWDCFVRHLLGEAPPKGFELKREEEEK